VKFVQLDFHAVLPVFRLRLVLVVRGLLLAPLLAPRVTLVTLACTHSYLQLYVMPDSIALLVVCENCFCAICSSN